MALPPVELGEVNDNVAEPFPAVATTPSGALGVVI
jgi:hypothetical protein